MLHTPHQYRMPLWEMHALPVMRLPGLPANDDHGRQPTVELMAHRRRRGCPTRDAAYRRGPEDAVYRALIERRADWPRLIGATVKVVDGGWEVNSKWFLPRDLAQNPIALDTGVRFPDADVFCLLLPCTRAELCFAVDEVLQLGLDFSELDDPAPVTVPAQVTSEAVDEGKRLQALFPDDETAQQQSEPIKPVVTGAEPESTPEKRKKAKPNGAGDPQAETEDQGDPGPEARDQDDNGLPEIRLIDAELPRIVDEAEQVLIDSGEDIYQRGGNIVRPVVAVVPAADGRTTVSHRLGNASAIHIAETMTKVATFQKFSKSGKTESWKAVSCPPRIAATFLARMQWGLRPLAGVIVAPTLRYDGSILDKPGYDERTALIFDPSGTEFPPIPLHPSRADAQVALELLEDLLSKFCFVGAIDRAVILAAILTALVRRSLPSAPIFVITAPDFGYGKTLLADIISCITEGDICPVSEQGDKEAEMSKHLGAALIAGAGIINIDNATGALGGILLSQMLTQRMVRIRVLGLSMLVDCSTAVTMLATGKNLTVTDDLIRRSVRCRLAGNVERPELRQFQKRPLDQIERKRGRYVEAALIIMRAYAMANRPRP